MKKYYVARMSLLGIISVIIALASVDHVKADTAPAPTLTTISQEVANLSKMVETVASIDSQRKAILAQVQDQVDALAQRAASVALMPTATEADRSALRDAIIPISNDIQTLSQVANALLALQKGEQNVLVIVSARLEALRIQLLQLAQTQ